MSSGPRRNDAPFWVTMRKLEADLLKWYLNEADDDVTAAAAMAGLDESTFYKKIRRMGIKRKKRRPGRATKPRKKKTPRDASTRPLSD